MSNKPKNIKSVRWVNNTCYSLPQSTHEEPQHTAQFSRVGFLILVAVSIISVSLIILAIW